MGSLSGLEASQRVMETCEGKPQLIILLSISCQLVDNKQFGTSSMSTPHIMWLIEVPNSTYVGFGLALNKLPLAGLLPMNIDARVLVLLEHIHHSQIE